LVIKKLTRVTNNKLRYSALKNNNKITNAKIYYKKHAEVSNKKIILMKHSGSMMLYVGIKNTDI